MIQFVTVFSDEQIVVLAIRQLSWTHFIALIPLRSELQQEFYFELYKVEEWNTITLREMVGPIRDGESSELNDNVKSIKKAR